MARMRVVLYCEQYATVEVDADPDADPATLTRLAHAVLDESGGAQWVSYDGGLHESRVLAPGEDNPTYDPNR